LFAAAACTKEIVLNGETLVPCAERFGNALGHKAWMP